MDVGTLEDRLVGATSSVDSIAVDVPSALQSLGVARLGALTPPMAAERLDWFLSQFTVDNPESNRRTAEITANWSARTMSVPINGLMRQLVADEALSRRLEEREPKRQWLRRDLCNLGTLIPVTEGNTSKVLRIGTDAPRGPEPDAVVFTEALSKFARARLVNDRQCFVERPADQTEIAYVLGDGAGAGDFGIRLRNDPPTPRAVRGAETELDGDQLEGLRTRLRERREFLLAACLENVAGINLENANRELTAVFENPIGVVQRDGADGRRNSAKWEASNDDGGPRIALFRDSLNRSQAESDDESEEIPAYLAADGLVQVLEQYDLRDTFETILFKDVSVLENEYRTTLRDVRQDIAELRARRLERTHEALSGLVTTLAEDVTLLSPESVDVDPGTTLEAAGMPDNGRETGTEEVVRELVEPAAIDNPLLRSWVDELTDGCGLSRENAAVCIFAAATEDHGERLRAVLQLDRTGVLDADALADADEWWRDLTVWPDDARSRSVKSYVEEADQIRRFFEYLAEHEDEGEDGIYRAIRDVLSATQPPSPLTAVTAFVPKPGALETDLRDRRLGELAYMDRDTPATDAVAEAIASWVTSERNDLQESDVIYRDSEVNELLARLAEAAVETESPAGNVEEAFEEFQNQAGRQATGAESTRADRTAEWITASDDSLRNISQKFGEVSADSTAKGDSPDIGESSNGGYDHVNAQIDVRGRDGELICLERAWNRFCDTPCDVRSDILAEVRRWRSYDHWRLDSIDDATTSASDTALGVGAGGDELLERLTGEDLNGGRSGRAAFHALFDTSAERGPGFDLIDPFAAMPNDQSLSEWSADWMRRVEAKAVASTRLRKGRIKLTGNELRMALREGPYGEGADTRRYLVRLVGFPSGWRDEEVTSADLQILDIEHVAEFAGLDPEATSILEKLRGGSFYVTYSTGE